MGSQSSGSSVLLAGVARADVTPPLGTWLAGYAVPDRPADRVDDPLHATALVLEQGDERTALLSLDWIIIEEPERFAIASAVEERTGIPARQIIVHAIQTHSAPQTQSVYGFNPKDEAYIASVLPRIVDCVCEAWEARQPARFGVGVGRCDGAVNRREIREDGQVVLGVNPFGPYDPEVTVLRFDTADGHLATVVHYGAHPTTRGADCRGVSRDWPGVAVDLVETHTGGLALFLNGVVGDVAPRNTLRGPQGSVEVGTVVGREAARVFDTIRCEGGPLLRPHSEEVNWPLEPLESREALEAKLRESPDRPDDWFAAAARQRHQAALAALESGDVKTQRPFLHALLRIGDAAILPLPGEVFAEIGLRIKRASPFAHTLVASTTNGSLGYLVTREARARGGFEVRVADTLFGATPLHERIDDFLVEEGLRLLRALYQ